MYFKNIKLYLFKLVKISINYFFGKFGLVLHREVALEALYKGYTLFVCLGLFGMLMITNEVD